MTTPVLAAALESEIAAKTEELVRLHSLTSSQLGILYQFLAELALVLTARSNRYSSRTGYHQSIPKLPDAAAKKQLPQFLLESRVSKPHLKPKLEWLDKTREQAQIAELIEWGVAAGFLVESEQLVSFQKEQYQDYFCLRYFRELPFENLLPFFLTGINFRNVWVLWDAYDPQLAANLNFSLSRLYSLLKDVKDHYSLSRVGLKSPEDHYAFSSFVRALEVIGTPAAIEPLCELLPGLNKQDALTILHTLPKSPTPLVIATLKSLVEQTGDLQKWAAVNLGKCGEVVFDYLADLIQSQNPTLRIMAATAFENLHSDKARDLLLNMLNNDSNDKVRGAAALALGHLTPDEELVAVLVKALHDEARSVRDSALDALSRSAYWDYPEVIEAFAQLLNEPSEGYRWYTALELFWFKDVFEERYVPGFLNVAASDIDYEIREPAIEQLGHSQSEQVVDFLLNKLQDEQEEVDIRGECAMALGEIGNQKALPVLLELLQNNKTPGLKISLVSALGSFKDEQAHEILLNLTKEANPRIRAAAYSSLGRQNMPGTFEVLKQALEVEKAEVRKDIQIRLSWMDGPVLMDRMIESLHDSDPFIRYSAIHSLQRKGDEQALPYLQWLRANDNTRVIDDIEIREMATLAIKEITRRIGQQPTIN